MRTGGGEDKPDTDGRPKPGTDDKGEGSDKPGTGDKGDGDRPDGKDDKPGTDDKEPANGDSKPAAPLGQSCQYLFSSGPARSLYMHLPRHSIVAKYEFVALTDFSTPISCVRGALPGGARRGMSVCVGCAP